MRQVFIARHGGPECLELRTAPDPTPAAGQVRIRVRAAGVNFADVLGRMGLYPDAPKGAYVPGYEVAGVVDACGPGVTRATGERVLAFTRFGGYADVICVPASFAVPLPDDLGFEEAAAIPVQYLTAYHMVVVLGNLRRDEVLFVHGLGGGVGIAALQIGLHAGARVMGSASPGKHARLRELGAERAFGYDLPDLAAAVKEATGGKGAHMVLDPVGGPSFRTSYDMLAPTGRLFLFGFSSMAPGRTRQLLSVLWQLLRTPSFKPIPLMNDNRGVHGVNLGRLWSEEALLQWEMERILELRAQGVVRPLLSRSFPLEEAAAAHAFLQDRGNVGKVVLTVG